ncbi:MAG: c-type cytochrome [Bacteroidota bacterium]|jgi:cytochrome c6
MTLLNKIFIFFSSLILLIACTGNSGTTASGKSTVSGSELFRRHCVLCHGATGNLGLNGARDLTQSKLNREQRISIISNGKAAMPVFRQLLTEHEIETVADYTFTLSTTANE